jgi:hypothetical protein
MVMLFWSSISTIILVFDMIFLINVFALWQEMEI